MLVSSKTHLDDARSPRLVHVDQVTGRGIELFDHVRNIGAEEAARLNPGRMAPELAGLRVGAFREPVDPALIS
jgi:hypothetical protein